jgi:hypothetical protein
MFFAPVMGTWMMDDENGEAFCTVCRDILAVHSSSGSFAKIRIQEMGKAKNRGRGRKRERKGEIGEKERRAMRRRTANVPEAEAPYRPVFMGKVPDKRKYFSVAS